VVAAAYVPAAARVATAHVPAVMALVVVVPAARVPAGQQAAVVFRLSSWLHRQIVRRTRIHPTNSPDAPAQAQHYRQEHRKADDRDDNCPDVTHGKPPARAPMPGNCSLIKAA